MPLRLVALLLPGLELMRGLHKSGLEVPNYIVYQATQLIAETNGIDEDHALEVAQQMEDYIHRFINEYYADIAEYVELQFQLPQNDSVRRDIEEISSLIRAEVAQNEALQKIVHLFKKSEERHSKLNGNSITYAAANALFNGAIPSRYTIKGDPKAILNIGGEAEKPFFHITSLLAKEHAHIPVIPMETHIGKRPTYYPYKDIGDPIQPEDFDDFFTRPNDGPIRHDLEALKQIGLNTNSIRAMLSTTIPSLLTR